MAGPVGLYKAHRESMAEQGPLLNTVFKSLMGVFLFHLCSLPFPSVVNLNSTSTHLISTNQEFGGTLGGPYHWLKPGKTFAGSPHPLFTVSAPCLVGVVTFPVITAETGETPYQLHGAPPHFLSSMQPSMKRAVELRLFRHVMRLTFREIKQLAQSQTLAKGFGGIGIQSQCLSLVMNWVYTRHERIQVEYNSPENNQRPAEECLLWGNEILDFFHEIG